MRMRDLLLTTSAAIALVLCSASASMAQKKKVPPASALSYKECCDRSNARFYVNNGRATCFAMSDQQQEALTRCVHERGIRVNWEGQKGI